jgi:hypothetical protein
MYENAVDQTLENESDVRKEEKRMWKMSGSGESPPH